MSSDSKDAELTTKQSSPQEERPLKELANTRGTLPDKYDLDKNPIKFRQWDGSLSTEAHDKDYMELVLRSGKHSDLVQKMLRQKIESRAQEFPRWPADASGGVRVLWIESRYWYDRERFNPDFDDDWRRYRSRYLHSLELDPSEPLQNSEWEKFLVNPIRRFYQKPGDWLEYKLFPKFTNDRHKAASLRSVIFKPLMGLGVAAFIYYRLRYTERDWEQRIGTTYLVGKPTIYPNDPRWPWKETKTSPWHHWDRGFLGRDIYKDLRDFDDDTVSL